MRRNRCMRKFKQKLSFQLVVLKSILWFTLFTLLVNEDSQCIANFRFYSTTHMMRYRLIY